MPRVVKNKSAIELVDNGKAAYTDEASPVIINNNVVQVLKSCNSIIESVNAYYETAIENIDYDHINNLKNAVNVLTDRLESFDEKTNKTLETCNSIDTNTNLVLESCSSIIGSLNAYHTSIVDSISKIDIAPDVSELKEINNRIITVMQMVSKEKVDAPKEWDFEIERDMTNKISKIKAKQIVH